MKRLLLLLTVIQVFAFCTMDLYAQKLKPADVPDDVVQTLDMQYSYAKVMSWVKEGNQYIATIKDEGSTGKVYISSDGEWLRTTFAVPQNELPSAITAYVKENYPEFAITESCLEEKDNEKTHYYLEVKPDGVGFKPSKLTFSTTGHNELISRVDPEDFKDPKAQAEKPAPAPKDNKQTAANTKPAQKPAAEKPAEKPAEAPAPKEERESIAQLRKLAANYEITPEQIMAYLAGNPKVKERFGSLDGVAFADLPDAIVSWLSKGMDKVAAKIKQ